MSDIAAEGSALRPYPKISSRGRLGVPGVREWVALEKVHGAHFAVVCEGTGVRPAKRRELRGDDGLPAPGQGPLTRLQDLPCAFPARVPALFGLPGLADNLAEGYVLKPSVEWQESGPSGARRRPVGKVKQKAFAEDERFDGSRPYPAPPQGAAGIPAWLLVQASGLLTPARAAAAVSKLGPHASVDEVAEEITCDVVEETAEALGGLEDAFLRCLDQAVRPGARSLAVFDATDRQRSRPAGRHHTISNNHSEE
ncbi:hypothetical protein [Streptomyces sparsogenes]|uniref:hypothetical protein n=1 Tax=Streptomyces sparsogenes TaxID=67365 RepID=UPI0033F8C9A7